MCRFATQRRAAVGFRLGEQLSDTEGARSTHRLCSLGDVELAVDVLHVRLHRVHRHEQLGRDFGFGEVSRQVAQHSLLSCRQRLEHQRDASTHFVLGVRVKHLNEFAGKRAMRSPDPDPANDQLSKRSADSQERAQVSIRVGQCQRVLNEAER